MFTISQGPDKTISITRGDVANIAVTAQYKDGSPYTFLVGDVVRFNVFKKKDCTSIVLTKNVDVSEETQVTVVRLDKDDTKIGEIISKPVDYWYEVELNPDTEPQTIIGYDDVGEKIFRLYPEGSGPSGE